MISTLIKLVLIFLQFKSILTKGDDSYKSESDVSQLKQASNALPNILFKCPEQFGYYPDVTNCTKYYVCVFGEPLHESCTGGLYFSPELQTCDWPINVRCATNEQNFKGDILDDSLSAYQSFGEQEDSRRLEYQTNETPLKSNENQRQYIESGDRIDFKAQQTEADNQNQYLNRKPNAKFNTNQTQTTSTSTESGEEFADVLLKTELLNEFTNESRVDDKLDNNKLFEKDLQNPDFEEAIASYVDENGGIHLHDGPGGLFGLVPPDTVSDHHIDIFSRPALQDNREKQVKEKSINNNKKELKYDEYQRNRGPKVVQFDDDIESEQMSEKIRKDLIQQKDEIKQETTTAAPAVSSTPKPNQTFDSKRNTNQTIPKTKAKHISEQLVNKFNNNNNNNQNLIKNHKNNSVIQKSSELMTRIPRLHQQRPAQQHKYYKINAQNIANFNPLVKYIKTLDSEWRLEPLSYLPFNFSQHLSAPIAKQQPNRPVTTTTPPTVFYSYRNNDNYRKFTTTPMPLNTSTTNKRPVSPTQGSYYRHISIDKLIESKTSVIKNLSKVSATLLPARPLSLFPTPDPFVLANKCTQKSCQLPDCFCGGTDIPVGLTAKQIPQIIVITFDDAVNDVNWHIYEDIFTSERKNPNSCPIRGTFYVSHEWTDYGQVQSLYSRGHEIASHSITHSFGEKFSKSQWIKEIAGQREIIHTYGGVALEDIRGMRAPFLQIGGNKQFEMLYEMNFTYDSSMSIFENSPPFWPYTLDYAINHECMIAPCPTKSFPGLWEIGLVMWQDLRGGRCSMGDACSNPLDENGIYEMILKNFNRHYQSNRAPFGLYYHSAWFNTRHHLAGFLKFIDEILKLNDVYFVTNWQLIKWMREPTPLSRIHKFNGWKCSLKNDSRPTACHNPTVCNVSFKKGSRFFKTCQPCPDAYPWLGNTGLKRKEIFLNKL